MKNHMEQMDRYYKQYYDAFLCMVNEYDKSEKLHNFWYDFHFPYLLFDMYMSKGSISQAEIDAFNKVNDFLDDHMDDYENVTYCFDDEIEEIINEAKHGLKNEISLNFDVNEENYWTVLYSLIAQQNKYNIFDDIVTPTENILKEYASLRGDLDALELRYISQLREKMQIMETKYKGAYTSTPDTKLDPKPIKSDNISPRQVEVVKIGGTSDKLWPGIDEYTATIGIDIKNPNPTCIAYGIIVDITLKDAAGRVIKVENDTVSFIYPGQTFHYGTVIPCLYEKPANISATAYAREFPKIGSAEPLNIASFGNISTRYDKPYGSMTGIVSANYIVPLERLYLHFHFINAQGEIIGGGNEFIDYLPGQGTRSIEYSGFIPPSVSRVKYTFDIDLSELLSQLESALG